MEANMMFPFMDLVEDIQKYLVDHVDILDTLTSLLLACSSKFFHERIFKRFFKYENAIELKLAFEAYVGRCGTLALYYWCRRSKMMISLRSCVTEALIYGNSNFLSQLTIGRVPATLHTSTAFLFSYKSLIFNIDIGRVLYYVGFSGSQQLVDLFIKEHVEFSHACTYISRGAAFGGNLTWVRTYQTNRGDDESYLEALAGEAVNGCALNVVEWLMDEKLVRFRGFKGYKPYYVPSLSLFPINYDLTSYNYSGLIQFFESRGFLVDWESTFFAVLEMPSLKAVEYLHSKYNVLSEVKLNSVFLSENVLKMADKLELGLIRLLCQNYAFEKEDLWSRLVQLRTFRQLALYPNLLPKFIEFVLYLDSSGSKPPKNILYSLGYCTPKILALFRKSHTSFFPIIETFQSIGIPTPHGISSELLKDIKSVAKICDFFSREASISRTSSSNVELEPNMIDYSFAFEGRSFNDVVTIWNHLASINIADYTVRVYNSLLDRFRRGKFTETETESLVDWLKCHNLPWPYETCLAIQETTFVQYFILETINFGIKLGLKIGDGFKFSRNENFSHDLIADMKYYRSFDEYMERFPLKMARIAELAPKSIESDSLFSILIQEIKNERPTMALPLEIPFPISVSQWAEVFKTLLSVGAKITVKFLDDVIRMGSFHYWKPLWEFCFDHLHPPASHFNWSIGTKYFTLEELDELQQFAHKYNYRFSCSHTDGSYLSDPSELGGKRVKLKDNQSL